MVILKQNYSHVIRHLDLIASSFFFRKNFWVHYYSSVTWLDQTKSAYDLFSIMLMYKSDFKLIKRKSHEVNLTANLQT